MADEPITPDQNAGGDQSPPAQATGSPTGDVTPSSGGNPPEEGSSPPAAFEWPEGWRDQITDDPKERKRLERLKTPADIWKSYREGEKKWSSAYREHLDVPSDPSGYLEELPDGLVFGDADKELVDNYTAAAHANNLPKDVAQFGLNWYAQMQEKAAADRSEADAAAVAEGSDALHQEWGPEYRANLNGINNFLKSASYGDDGGTLYEALGTARLADGRPLLTDPAVMMWLQERAQDANPAGFLAPGTPGMQIDSVQSRLNEIRNIRRSDSKRYYKDEALQREFRDLLAAEEKLATRA